MRDLADLWKKSSEDYKIQINNLISKEHFVILSKYKQISKYNGTLATPNINIENKAEKFEEFLKYLNDIFSNFYLLKIFLSIDETMCQNKQRTLLIRYLPAKHTKFGIKFFCLSSSDKGNINKMLVYIVKRFISNKKTGQTLGGYVLFKLYENLDSRVHITYDNFYS